MNLVGDVQRGERAVTRGHHHCVARSTKRLDHVGGIVTHRARKRQKAVKGQAPLHLVPGQGVTRVAKPGALGVGEGPVRERDDAHAFLREPAVGGVVTRRLLRQQSRDHLGGALHQHPVRRLLPAGLRHGGDGGHALQRAAEVVANEYLDGRSAAPRALGGLGLGHRRYGVVSVRWELGDCLRAFGPRLRQSFVPQRVREVLGGKRRLRPRVEPPLDAHERRLFKRVPERFAVHLHQRVAAGEDEGRGLCRLGARREFRELAFF
mmetsp:Transcript_1832/g.8182  ORF Transcript_1832/g.8182 Transcript_1832/m.8182 type:complete len:264 (+) Transcript_1832:1939-2730(+)